MSEHADRNRELFNEYRKAQTRLFEGEAHITHLEDELMTARIERDYREQEFYRAQTAYYGAP